MKAYTKYYGHVIVKFLYDYNNKITKRTNNKLIQHGNFLPT
jgi:hypothetical protein